MIYITEVHKPATILLPMMEWVCLHSILYSEFW